MMKGKLLRVALVLLLSAGCATFSEGRLSDGDKITDPESLALVVGDLLFVMQQLKPLNKTTVQYRRSGGLFGELAYSNLHEAGYGMQKVTADQGANFLTHEVTALAEADGGRQYRYTIGVGNVSVERHYVDVGGCIYPGTPMIVRGVSEPGGSAVTLNPDLFDVMDDDLAYLFQLEYREQDVSAIAIPRIRVIDENLGAAIARSTLRTADSESESIPARTGINSSNMEITNLYFTNESNFSDATRGYQTIHREVIVFDNDSMRLGTQGKRRIHTISLQFNADSDYIQVLGCSNGYTALEGGNEGLALGRAARVVTEFSSLGVPRTSLLDEGCWAPERLDGRYPRRGVVIELKRRDA